MNLLLTAATPPEIAPTLNWLRARAVSEAGNVLTFEKSTVEILFTGVGQLATAYALGRRFGEGPLPDFCFQAGIAGALDRTLALGQVVRITSERLGDLGAEDRDGSFLSLSKLGLFPGIPYDEDEVLRLPAMHAPFRLKSCAGLTVNTTSGTAARIAALRERYPAAQVESMEGAAFFHACLLSGLEPIAVRAISNYVEPRDRASWEIEQAVANLNEFLRGILGGLLVV
ncbi:MAG: futalosine hydrolase [Bacteroidota bacterium]